MKDYKEIVFILDRSGSMAGLERDTIGGFNAMLEKNKEQGNAIVSTVLFDDKIDVICDRENIKNVRPMTKREYYVRGCTALLDAVGRSIKHVSKIQKALPKHHRASKTLFVITTDGYENASREFDYPEVKRLIENKRAKGWEFIFMGANIDAAAEAARMGITADRAATYCADERGTHAVYGSIAVACEQLSSCDGITGSWKLGIEKDMASRS